MTPNILIADDHSMIRKGIRLLLMTRLNYKNIQEADSCSGVMNELKKGGFTHIILDVILTDGSALEIVPVIKELYPDLKIMIFSMQPAEIYADAFRQYDIQYYLNKSVNEEETLKYFSRFLNNEPGFVYPAKDQGKQNLFSLLTPRELEILHYLLNGYRTQDIAQTLNLGNSTISTFKKRIFEKTGLTNLAQLYEMASVNDLAFYLNSHKKEDSGA